MKIKFERNDGNIDMSEESFMNHFCSVLTLPAASL